MRLLMQKKINATLQSAAGAWHDLPIVLSHTPDDPLAVQLRILVTEAEPPLATWVFARDLLAAGLTAPSGEGDVRISPHGREATDITLVSPQTWCVIRLPSSPVQDFIAGTHATAHHARHRIDTSLSHMLTKLLPQTAQNPDA
ncbi:SsgA family sporulation/cell division regulator [Streptomyces sp. NPDC091268]|uniref:SsgA family sporulation/cell division regulator n=1 Tax=Streptomyces sp. NPDC091268 TaxID=3365979 RepID=UPI0037F168E9